MTAVIPMIPHEGEQKFLKSQQRSALRGHQPELPPVVADAFRSAILGRRLQHHNVDRPGGVAPAGPDPALPVPSGPRLNVGDGQSTDGKQAGVNQRKTHHKPTRLHYGHTWQ